MKFGWSRIGTVSAFRAASRQVFTWLLTVATGSSCAASKAVLDDWRPNYRTVNHDPVCLYFHLGNEGNGLECRYIHCLNFFYVCVCERNYCYNYFWKKNIQMTNSIWKCQWAPGLRWESFVLTRSIHMRESFKMFMSYSGGTRQGQSGCPVQENRRATLGTHSGSRDILNQLRSRNFTVLFIFPFYT